MSIRPEIAWRKNIPGILSRSQERLFVVVEKSWNEFGNETCVHFDVAIFLVNKTNCAQLNQPRDK